MEPSNFHVALQELVCASGLFSALIVVLFFSNAHVAYICVTADVLHVTRNTLFYMLCSCEMVGGWGGGGIITFFRLRS